MLTLGNKLARQSVGKVAGPLLRHALVSLQKFQVLGSGNWMVNPSLPVALIVTVRSPKNQRLRQITDLPHQQRPDPKAVVFGVSPRFHRRK